MSELVSQILSQMPALTMQDRAELAYAFVRSLEPGEVEPEDQEGVEEAWREEVARRAAEIRSGKAVGKPAADLFAELRRRPS